MKPITIAIAGCGSRGMQAYAPGQALFPGRMRIVAAADIRPGQLALMRERYGLTQAQCYDSAESMLRQPRLADAMFICTPDRLHFGQAAAALGKGYHLLLEKPIAETEAECRELERLARQANRHVIVCHVLRYALFYQKLKELLDGGAVGEIQSIQAMERVGYWHQAHSFVRGNWGNAGKSSPMILQKCCHDMDILLWLTGKHCLRVSSFGALSHFDAAHAPAGAPLRCTDGCPAGDTCPYNAERYYMGKLRAGQLGWPLNVVASCPDENSVMAALREGPYGRCVYHCDNDVVDHQVVNLLLEDGATISFTMCAFTAQGGREIHLMGTKGDIYGDLARRTIEIHPFGGEVQTLDLRTPGDAFGHGGGDEGIVRDLLSLLRGDEGDSTRMTTLTRSIESHLVCEAAETSRLRNGEAIEVK